MIRDDPHFAPSHLLVDLARAIATEMGLPSEKIEGIRMAGVVHDIGKISLPTEILSKPTKFSAIEFSLIKEHARQGYEILKDVESCWPLAEIEKNGGVLYDGEVVDVCLRLFREKGFAFS